MITLITATPGSGKTLTCIGMILEAKKEGRPIYTNINGLNIEGIHDAPDDWRDTPEGSLVIYDECQQPHLYPSNAQRGRVEDERLTAMETHRHTGHDLIFVTQAPTFVHHHIRKLVGEHIHLYRARGVPGAMRYEWSHTCDQPNDRREQERADSQFWKFPKEHFQYYTSATEHTHKFKIPRKITVLLGFILAGFSVLAFALVKQGGLASMQDSEPEPPPATVGAEAQPAAGGARALPASRYDWSKAEETIPVSGCIASETRCMCFSESGITLDITDGACRSVIEAPLPRNYTATAKGRKT